MYEGGEGGQIKYLVPGYIGDKHINFVTLSVGGTVLWYDTDEQTQFHFKGLELPCLC